MRPICPSCNQRPKTVAYHRNNKIYYRSQCGQCIRKKKKLPIQRPRWELNGYKKKTICDRCGFKARYSAQLLVFHIDSNLNNSTSRNLKTLCLNCRVDVEKSNFIWKPGDLQPDT